jgi:hypothetical protein
MMAERCAEPLKSPGQCEMGTELAWSGSLLNFCPTGRMIMPLC